MSKDDGGHWGRHVERLIEAPKVTTEDGVVLAAGAYAYDYYSMKPGWIGAIHRTGDPTGPWFDFNHTDGTVQLLNGQRICSIEYARRRQFKGAHVRPEEVQR